ncbi:MAG: hypothetical protein HY699_02015 [Deltaproteobacteria bacterium]|nr:hypothetical protein [Deltaproteobacteria bacterium]
MIDTGATWYAVQTQPRREEAAAANVRRIGALVSCPYYRQRVILHGYRREVTRPLFPGYIFAAFDLARDFRAVHYAHGVRGLVRFGGVPAEVPCDFLAGIEARMQNGYVVIEPTPLEPGDRVEIVAGSFRGYTGIFQAGAKGSERVTILLEALKYQARLVLDRTAVAAL